MGVIPSLEFVPSDYTIKYKDSDEECNKTIHKSQNALIGRKVLKLNFIKGRTEIVKLDREDLTVGWLIEKAKELYDHLYENGKFGDRPKQEIVGIKTLE